MATTPARMVQRRRTVAQWASENPVLAAGEIGIATGGAAPLVKVGDGTTAWNDLGISLPEIQTGTLSTNTTFGGFESEDVAFGGKLLDSFSGSPTYVTTSGYPRWQLPATGTTAVITPSFNCPTWYVATDVHLGVSNDHTATGNVRIRSILREVDIGQALSAAATISDVTVTLASPAANGGVGIMVPVATVSFTPGFFGSIYSLELQRLGDDGADTLAGPLGIIAIGFKRMNL
jgi:hypothetical protein